MSYPHTVTVHHIVTRNQDRIVSNQVVQSQITQYALSAYDAALEYMTTYVKGESYVQGTICKIEVIRHKNAQDGLHPFVWENDGLSKLFERAVHRKKYNHDQGTGTKEDCVMNLPIVFVDDSDLIRFDGLSTNLERFHFNTTYSRWEYVRKPYRKAQEILRKLNYLQKQDPDVPGFVKDVVNQCFDLAHLIDKYSVVRSNEWDLVRILERMRKWIEELPEDEYSESIRGVGKAPEHIKDADEYFLWLYTMTTCWWDNKWRQSAKETIEDDLKELEKLEKEGQVERVQKLMEEKEDLSNYDPAEHPGYYD